VVAGEEKNSRHGIKERSRERRRVRCAARRVVFVTGKVLEIAKGARSNKVCGFMSGTKVGRMDIHALEAQAISFPIQFTPPAYSDLCFRMDTVRLDLT
jgi:hypothetical protein